MLTSNLLIHRYQGETLVPKQLALNATNVDLAAAVIAMFQAHQGKTQGELNQHWQDFEGEATDYRVKRGLAHILRNSFSTFEPVSPIEPIALRALVFAQAAQQVPSAANRDRVLQRVADELSISTGSEVLPIAVQQGLYADLKDNRILTEFDAPEPEALIHRYNLSQVQGLFYKASQVVINVHRNDPGEYKLLFRYLKLFRLMTYIEGDVEHGFTIAIDGPTSLFKPSTRYGVDIAKLIPALLHVTRWSLTATLQVKDAYSQTKRQKRFTLTSDCGLVSHYPPGKTYDSMIEESFANRWDTLQSDWRLEREVNLIPIPGSVMIPDFRLVHPDGRDYVLEIVGYWRPDYLRKKFSQVRQSQCDNLILAVSERLNLEKAGVRLEQVPAQIVWFKHKLSPKLVHDVLEAARTGHSK